MGLESVEPHLEPLEHDEHDLVGFRIMDALHFGQPLEHDEHDLVGLHRMDALHLGQQLHLQQSPYTA